MASTLPVSSPGVGAFDLFNLTQSAATAKLSAAGQERAHKAAQDFEAVFLNSMFQHMFTGIDGEGPFGGKGATGMWRSVLTDQYAKSVAKAGGVGIADQVYRSLIAHQETRS